MKNVTRKLRNEPVLCDDCKKTFKIKRVREKKHKDGVEGVLTIQYFACPHCKKKYVTAIKNKKLEDMIKERKRIYSGIRNLKDPDETNQAFDKVDALDSKIKSLNDHLKFFFSKYV